MLPSSGYFRSVTCPYFKSGLCERPYCHYRHTVNKPDHSLPDRQSEAASLVVGAAKKDGRAVGEPGSEDLVHMVSSAIRQMQRVVEQVNSNSKTPDGLKQSKKALNTTYQPTPLAKLQKCKQGTDDSTLHERNRRPTVAKTRSKSSVPEYRPTPLNKLRQKVGRDVGKSSRIEYNPDGNTEKYIPPYSSPPKGPLYKPTRTSSESHRSGKSSIREKHEAYDPTAVKSVRSRNNSENDEGKHEQYDPTTIKSNRTRKGSENGEGKHEPYSPTAINVIESRKNSKNDSSKHEAYNPTATNNARSSSSSKHEPYDPESAGSVRISGTKKHDAYDPKECKSVGSDVHKHEAYIPAGGDRESSDVVTYVPTVTSASDSDMPYDPVASTPQEYVPTTSASVAPESQSDSEYDPTLISKSLKDARDVDTVKSSVNSDSKYQEYVPTSKKYTSLYSKPAAEDEYSPEFVSTNKYSVNDAYSTNKCNMDATSTAEGQIKCEQEYDPMSEGCTGESPRKKDSDIEYIPSCKSSSKYSIDVVRPCAPNMYDPLVNYRSNAVSTIPAVEQSVEHNSLGLVSDEATFSADEVADAECKVTCDKKHRSQEESATVNDEMHVSLNIDVMNEDGKSKSLSVKPRNKKSNDHKVSQPGHKQKKQHSSKDQRDEKDGEKLIKETRNRIKSDTNDTNDEKMHSSTDKVQSKHRHSHHRSSSSSSHKSSAKVHVPSDVNKSSTSHHKSDKLKSHDKPKSATKKDAGSASEKSKGDEHKHVKSSDRHRGTSVSESDRKTSSSGGKEKPLKTGEASRSHQRRDKPAIETRKRSSADLLSDAHEVASMPSSKKHKAAHTPVYSNTANIFDSFMTDASAEPNDEKGCEQVMQTYSKGDIYEISSDTEDDVWVISDGESGGDDAANMLDVDLDSHDTYEECLKIFKEPVKPKSSQSTPSVVNKFKKQETEASSSVSGRQRHAHPSTDGGARSKLIKQRPHCRLSPAQVMHNRFLQLQKAANEAKRSHAETVPRKQSSSVLPSSSSASGSIGSLHAPTTTTARPMIASGVGTNSGKKRLQHTPMQTASARGITALKKRSQLIRPEDRTAGRTIAKGSQRMAHTPLPAVLARPTIPSDYGSKVATNIRQRYLNLFIDEYIRICSNEAESHKKGLDEEKIVYDRSSTKGVYLNVAVHALKRLRDQVGQVLPSDVKKQNSKCVSKQPTHEENLGGRQATKTTYTLNRSGKHAQLDLSTEAELYKQLKPYLLTEKQLEDNGFPFMSPDKPGCAVLVTTTKAKSAGSANSLERLCCRCGNRFRVNAKGRYVTKDECVYHWGRPWKKKVAGAWITSYTCCSGDSNSEGCSVNKLHVIDVKSLTGFVKTLPKTPPLDGNFGVYALDCEMAYTTEGIELIRVTVVESDCKPVYETLVKPDHPVIDFNTRFSGIKEEDMLGVTTTLRDVQAVLLSRFNAQTILMGHSLESDLMALKLVHQSVVDTSVVFPHRLGPPFKRALRNLMAEHLKKIIQDSVDGHDSQEDAVACLELMIWKIKEDAKLGIPVTS
ncbi:PREDICTED: RNA exonuclease 1 homolog [Priapulus caudatus]|uniref:RNA exonuclease 1 homolog n=1 Tax=Priapulus caudatus TaxID=37621 RepID=A0ABM1EJS0_PRICU|nr:PREDICTED: RNA exonuclease 1 homolog [Priapulus caudatus]